MTAPRFAEIGQEVRLGMMRVYGPFTHPILGGAFLVALLPVHFAALGNLPRSRALSAFVALLGFFSLSSAAILAPDIRGGGIVALKL